MRSRRRAYAGLAVGALVLALSACVPPAPAPVPTREPVPTPTPAGGIDKVLVFVLENHDLVQSMKQLPATMQLLRQYSYATQFRALTHPSLPNYLAIAGGSTFGVTDDRKPGAHPIHGASVFGAAIEAGGTAAVYAEGMDSNCQRHNAGVYAVRHNPWTYFLDERDLCAEFDVPLEQLSGAIDAAALPQVGLVVPGLCNDAHDCPLSTTDAWFAKWLPRVMDGPDFRSGRLAIVVTADEDDRSHDNLILTGVIHPDALGQIVTTPLNHLSLSRLLSEVAGAAPLRDAADAPSMSDAFGLTLAG